MTMCLRSLFPLHLKQTSSSSSVPSLTVCLIVFAVLVVLCAALYQCRTRCSRHTTTLAETSETFTSDQPNSRSTPPPFHTNASVHVRYGQAFCFYTGTIRRLHLDPKTKRPYTEPTKANYNPEGSIVVQYTPGHTESPNGGEFYEEIPLEQVYAYPGNRASRDVCRVFLQQSDVDTNMWRTNTNSHYIRNVKRSSGANDVQMTLMCRPASLINTHPATKTPIPPDTSAQPKRQSLVRGNTAVKQATSKLSTSKTPVTRSHKAPPSRSSKTKTKTKTNTKPKPSLTSTTQTKTRPATRNPVTVQKKVVQTPGTKSSTEPQKTPTSTVSSSRSDKQQSPRVGGDTTNVVFVCGRDAHAVNTGDGSSRPTHFNLKQTGVESFVVDVSDVSGTIASTKNKATSKDDPQAFSFTAAAKSFHTKAKKKTQELSEQVKAQNAALAKRMSASMDVDATYVELLNDIMTTVWKNTYIDVRLNVVNAAPSITSDTYHTLTDQGVSNRLYYNTANGCVSPHMADTSPQSAMLKAHPNACSGTTYELEYGSVGEVCMLGSNEGGYALLMFPQLIQNMRSELRDVMGVEPGLIEGFVSSVNMAVFFYYPLRKHVRAQTLKRLFAAIRTPVVVGGGSKSSPVARMQSQLQQLSKTLQDLVQKVSKAHPVLEYVTPENSALYTRLSNRMLPMFAVRANQAFTHAADPTTASQSPAVFCCEHDMLVSVGYGNTDCAAEVSMSSFQNTSMCRLMTGGSMSKTTHEMISDTFGETVEMNLVERDRVFLRELLGIFLGTFSVALLDQLQHDTSAESNRDNTGGGSSSTAQHTANARSFMAIARQLLTETGVQLMALVAGVPPTEMVRMASVSQWIAVGTQPTDSTRRETAAWRIVDALSKTEARTTTGIPPTSQQALPHVVSHVTVLVDMPRLNQPKRVTVNLPWKYAVFGVLATVGAAHKRAVHVELLADTTSTTTQTDRQTISLLLTRTAFPYSTQHSGPIRIYLTKRVTVEQLSPHTWIPRMLNGHHTEYTSGNMVQSLTHLPTYSIAHSPITSMFDGSFHSGREYRSKDGFCYSVKCANEDQTNGCCPGTTDVSMCTPHVTRMDKCATGGGPGHVTPHTALCHGDAFDTNECSAAFRQMLQNVRNATLVLDSEAVMQLVDFLTDPSMASVHIAALHKAVKTLVLTTTLFHDLALELQTHTQAKGMSAMPKLTTAYQDRVQKWKTTLDTLSLLYGIVAIVAPSAMCDTGGTMLSNINDLRTTVKASMEEHCKSCKPTPPPKTPECKQSTHKVTKVVYQMYKTLTLTFRRRFDNSYNWSTHQTSLHDLQLINAQEAVYRADVSDYARTHHETADFSSSPDIMHTILSYSCTPEMVATIKGITWYGRDPIVEAVDSKDPLAVSLLPPCESKQ